MPNKLLKIVTLVFSILLLASSYQLYVDTEKIKMQEKNISDLLNETSAKDRQLAQREITISDLKQNLSRTETLLKNETQTKQKLEAEIINLTTVNKVEYSVLAVDEFNQGHVIQLEVILKEGSGNLFLNVANVLVDETMQFSAQTAILVARDVTRTSLIKKDVLINIKSQEQANLIISGGSAGAAITLASIAAMQGRTIRKDVLITGTIREDHTIGRIGEPRAKGLAAKENGAVLFLVPETQKSEAGEIGIEVKEVRTIEDAMRYVLPQS